MPRRRAEVVLPPAGLAAGGVAVWALLTWGGRGALPTPARAAATLVEVVGSGELPRAAGRTLLVLAAGFAVSTALGIGLGLALGLHRAVDRALSPYLAGLQALPSVVWVPVAVVVLGASDQAALAVTVLGALPAVAVGTREAVRGVPPLLVRAARSLGSAGPRLLGQVVLPAALPGVVAALALGWAFAFRTLVAAELLTGAAGASGLGSFVTAARDAGRVDRLLAAVAAILAVGVLVDRLGFAWWAGRLRARRGLAGPGPT